jgi:hypothetical protein
MGQPITVVRKPSSNPAIVRFETNRTLTGTGHEHYHAGVAVSGERPPDVLARRLFEKGGIGIASVHVHSNIIDVELAAGGSADGLDDLIRELYIHYKPGVAPSFPA